MTGTYLYVAQSFLRRHPSTSLLLHIMVSPKNHIQSLFAMSGSVALAVCLAMAASSAVLAAPSGNLHSKCSAVAGLTAWSDANFMGASYQYSVAWNTCSKSTHGGRARRKYLVTRRLTLCDGSIHGGTVSLRAAGWRQLHCCKPRQLVHRLPVGFELSLSLSL